jgi:hypothetical protein
VSRSLRRDAVEVQCRGRDDLTKGSPERRYGRYATHLSSTLLQVSCSTPNFNCLVSVNWYFVDGLKSSSARERIVKSRSAVEEVSNKELQETALI